MTTEIRTMSVPFHGNDLFLVDVGGEPFTPMKPIVEGMGLSWTGQNDRLNRDRERWGIRVIRIPSQSGDQDTLCMPLRKLPGWLMTIQVSRLKPEIREKALAFQNECDDVLWEYWTKGQVTNPRLPEDHPVPEPSDRILERERLRLEAMQLRTDRAMKLKKTILDFREREIFGLADARRAAWSVVVLLLGEDPTGPSPGEEKPVPADEDPATLVVLYRALAQEPLALLWTGGSSGLDSWLMERGIPPTSRNLETFERISRKIFDISYTIRERILEEERRIPSYQETLEAAVRQFLEEQKG